MSGSIRKGRRAALPAWCAAARGVAAAGACVLPAVTWLGRATAAGSSGSESPLTEKDDEKTNVI